MIWRHPTQYALLSVLALAVVIVAAWNLGGTSAFPLARGRATGERWAARTSRDAATVPAPGRVPPGPALGEARPRESSGPGLPPAAPLPEAERSYLWDVEHHGNVLAASGLAALAAGLRRGDRPALQASLAREFRAHRRPSAPAIAHEAAWGRVIRCQDGPGPPVELD